MTGALRTRTCVLSVGGMYLVGHTVGLECGGLMQSTNPKLASLLHVRCPG
jgi:hypothetical protein